MMNKKYYLLLFAVAGLLTMLLVPASCDEDIRSPLDKTEEALPALTATPDTINASVTGGTYPIAVTCEGAWIAYADNSLFPWISVSSGSATGSGTFSVTVGQLPNSLYERTAPVTIRFPNTTRVYKEVVVRQVEEEPAITITGLPDEIPAAGGDIPVEIVSNAPWSASFTSDISDWISLSPAEGAAGTHSATFTVEVTPAGHAKRSAILTFRAGTRQIPIRDTVYQAGEAVSLTVNNNFPAEVPYGGGSYTITITGNAIWNMSPGTVAWCTLSPTFGDGDATVTATIAPHRRNDRATTITVMAEDETKVIGITQSGLVETGVQIGGVTWSTRNVDIPGEFADYAWDYGKLYQFAHTVPHPPRLSSEGKPAGWDTDFVGVDGWDEAAHPVCPAGWRLPTKEELRILRPEGESGDADESWSVRYGAGGSDDGNVGRFWGPGAKARFTNRVYDKTYDCAAEGFLFLPAETHRRGDGMYLDTTTFAKENLTPFPYNDHRGAYWSSEGDHYEASWGQTIWRAWALVFTTSTEITYGEDPNPRWIGDGWLGTVRNDDRGIYVSQAEGMAIRCVKE
jgi:hypothetical protein